MGGLELDLKEYEDPAPKNLGSDLPGIGPTDVLDSAPLNRKKLPFRADVKVKGKSYRGARSSRADLELDTETLGLLDDADVTGRSDDSISVDDDLCDEDDDMQFDEDDGDEEGSKIDDDYSEIEDDLDDGSQNRAEELRADEQATVHRLLEAEKGDLQRARAVKKQRVSFILHFLSRCIVPPSAALLLMMKFLCARLLRSKT